MRCFFATDIPASGMDVTLEDRESRHLFGILRARPGEKIELIDGQGVVAVAEVLENRRMRVVERRLVQIPDRRVHLLVAPPRHQKMDQLLRQCAEVGAWRITPVSTAREVAKSGRDDVPERWRQHLVEGCKQAHNPFLPAIEPTRPLANALTAVADHAERWYGAVPTPGEPLPALSTVGPDLPGGDIAWLVGPEGGFTREEDEAIRAAGFRALSLGPWVLRVETAAIVGTAILARDTRKA